MAKRNSKSTDPVDKSARISPQALRWGNIVIKESIEQHAKCELHLAKIGRLLKQASSSSESMMNIDGYTRLKRAEELLETFAKYLENGLNDVAFQAALKAKLSQD